MHKKSKRVILALVCAVTMMASMVPASAAKRIGHVHVWTGSSRENQRVTGISEDGHTLSFDLVETCQDYETCHGVKITPKSGVYESHSWSGADDLGHCGKEEHAFRLRCGVCSGGKDVRILCEYNSTGRHNTP